MHLLSLAFSRFPPRRDLKLAFLVCAFPVAVWSWIIFIYDLPSFLRSLRISQIISIFAYVQVVSLIESFLLFALVTLLAVLLPRRLFLRNFLPQVSLLVLTLAFWAIGIHLYHEQVAMGRVADNPSLPYYWTAIWIAVFFALSILVRFNSRINSLLFSFVERLAFVSSVYLFFALISLPVVIIRNLLLAIT
jgi:hypothetical protein